jgi:hypothetical protein
MVAALAIASCGIFAAPGGAAAPATKCAALKGSVTITPGIGPVAKAQKAKATGNLTKCTPTKATGGSGTLAGTLTLPKNSSCTGLAQGKQSLKLTATSKWKNKKTSTYALVAKTGSGSTALVATITGRVTKGLFAGKKVTGGIKVALVKGQDCVTKPVTKLTFTQSKPFQIG